MANNRSTGDDRREHTRGVITDLLEERQQVWSQYSKIAAQSPFSASDSLELSLNSFCQILIDYVSLGHFGIYRRIADGSERRDRVIETAETLYTRIAKTTETAVNFNDKYAPLKGQALAEKLADDLSQLGEELATRIEYEDQLIEAILDR